MILDDDKMDEKVQLLCCFSRKPHINIVHFLWLLCQPYNLFVCSELEGMVLHVYLDLVDIN